MKIVKQSHTKTGRVAIHIKQGRKKTTEIDWNYRCSWPNASIKAREINATDSYGYIW